MNNAKRVYQTTLIALAALGCAASAQSTESVVLNETQKIVASDGMEFSQFGYSISMDENLAVIGAWQDSVDGTRTGSAYIYRLKGNKWIQEAKLVPSDGEAQDGFGNSVAISEHSVVVGAANHKDIGAAYVFRYTDGSWSEQVKLTPSDGTMGDSYGSSVSVFGDTVAVGSLGDDDKGNLSGSAYMYQIDENSNASATKIAAGDTTAGDQFGWSVDVHGDIALIGAPHNDDDGVSSGSAYIFQLQDGKWIETEKLLPLFGRPGAQFGSSVAIDENIVVVGSRFYSDGQFQTGSAYVFRHNGSSWPEESTLFATDRADGDQFGRSVSVFNDRVIIGAHNEDKNGDNSGAAYAFMYNGADWVQESKLLASNGDPQDEFGFGVAVFENHALIGAPRASKTSGFRAGSVYAYNFQPPSCRSDLNEDGITDIFDVFVFLEAFASLNPISDWNGDGSFFSDDVFAFIDEFISGC